MFSKNVSRAIKAMTAVLLVMISTTAFAQTNDDRNYQTYPHMFIGLQGGAQVALENYWDNMVTPIGQVSFGGWFTPVVGARLGLQGWQTKGALESVSTTYKYNYANLNLDLMVNLSNLITGKPYNRFNVILLGGVGGDYAWKNDALECLNAQRALGQLNYTEDLSNQWKDDQLSHNFRVGLMLDYDLGRHLSLNLELGANSKGDRWNSINNGRDDWQAYGLVGLSIKFGHKKRAAIEAVDMSTPVGNYEQTVETEQTATTTNTKVEKPAVITPATRMEQNIFFALDSHKITDAEMAKIDQLAAFLKDNPKMKVQLTGYADRETGRPAYNSGLSHRRMRNVYDELINRGISKDRINGDYKGDTIQPYAENEKNRVVICIAE